MERKIGEIFEYNGEWCQCVKGGRCDDCDFDGLYDCNNIACTSRERSDDKEVYFKKLEKIGEPYDDCGTILQRFRIHTNVTNADTKGLELNIYSNNTIGIEIKQNKEDMINDKKQTSLISTKDIYEKFKGKTVQCLVNSKDGDLVNGYGIVCGYTDRYLIIGFTNEYEGCIKSFTDNVFLENRDFLSYRFWNISHFDDKPFIKPFNLKAARSGKPVCTRDGRRVRIICFDLKNGEYPIVAAIENDSSETLLSYTINGEIVKGNYESDKDLMMLTEKKEGWVNVYKESIYNTKEEAIKFIYDGMTYIDTIKFSWEE